MTRSRLVLSISLGALLAHPPAKAQTTEDRNAARALAQQADEKVAAGQLNEAIELFQKADALLPAPTLKLAIARLLVKQGKIVEALLLMQDIAHSAPVALEPASWKRARADAAAEAQQLEGKPATLELHVTGASSPRVVLDGDVLPAAALGVPRVMNPGHHSLQVSLDGYKPITREFDLQEGQRLKLTLALEALRRAPERREPAKAAEAPPSSSRASEPAPAADARATRANQGMLWGGLAVAGVFSVTGAVTGFLAMRKADDLKDRCPDNHCPLALKSEQERAVTLANASTFSFVLAGGGLALSMVGLMMREEVPVTAQSSVRVQVGAGSLGLAGSF
jgi:hypothetical protein